MRLFTKLFLTAVIGLSSLLGSAATITVEVGDNFYRAADGSTTVRMTTTDELVFQNVGVGTHPTASSLWATFNISPASPATQTKRFPANSFMPGTYTFRCTAHFGQTGTLIVTLPTASAEARLLAPVLNLFPNPSKGGQVTVKMDQKPGQDYKLRLSNIIGREIRTVALKPDLSDAGLSLDLSDLPSGMYFYSLVLNDKVVSTKRLVLQN